MGRLPAPDFLVVGAPKAGTTALHAALSRHPQVFTTSPKEPKYFLCDDAPPPAYGGPGDRHSQQEWVWRRRDYDRLFEGAREDQLRGESTPFYLWSRSAHRRIAEQLPDVRLIAVVRDPIDRAASNWMHLWSDGLEPIGDLERALAAEPGRVDAGWAPFWRYAGLGRYGEQLEHLLRYVDRERVLVMRYRDLVDEPRAALDRACTFLGLETGLVGAVPRDNSRAYVEPGWRPRVLGPVVRAGARLGQFAPPEAWRRLSAPLVARLSDGADGHRPRLDPEVRERLLPLFADDVDRLSALTGEDFGDWLSRESRGSFLERQRQRRLSEPA
ncbi:sulfotransferase family protein [Nocardioides dongkuii]|uniref:sulfotransferase family protein n=1 Tax=Nocardioides dongkuii TaxID=2760089 RepID=UPI00187755E3|nr:sulfotransferase [Nocardioides dongkuii]